jgi:hypothetical protein
LVDYFVNIFALKSVIILKLNSNGHRCHNSIFWKALDGNALQGVMQIVFSDRSRCGCHLGRVFNIEVMSKFFCKPKYQITFFL